MLVQSLHYSVQWSIPSQCEQRISIWENECLNPVWNHLNIELWMRKIKSKSAFLMFSWLFFWTSIGNIRQQRASKTRSNMVLLDSCVAHGWQHFFRSLECTQEATWHLSSNSISNHIGICRWYCWTLVTRFGLLSKKGMWASPHTHSESQAGFFFIGKKAGILYCSMEINQTQLG